MPGIDIAIKDKIDASINRKLGQINTKANSAANAIDRMNRSMSGINANAISGAGSQLNGFFSSVQSGTAKMQGFGQSILHNVRALRSLVGAVVVVGAAMQGLSKIDTYRTMENQVRQTTDSQEGLATVMGSLFKVAERSRVPVDSLTKSYRRFDNALKEQGGSQKESLEMTETMAKMITLSGASAGEASSSLLQMSQAFNKGKLDGDEFRSVAENMPQVITGLTKVLGISRGEIFEWSRSGRLSIGALRKAFKVMKVEVDKQMESLPKTAGQAFTDLTNKLTQGFGKLDMRYGIVDGLVSGLEALGRNIPQITAAAGALVATIGMIAAPGAIAWMAGFVSKGTILKGGLLGIATALVMFSDQIPITADGVVTLRDGFWGLIETLKEFKGLLGFEDLQEGLKGLDVKQYSPGWTELNTAVSAVVDTYKEVVTLFATAMTVDINWTEAANMGIELFTGAWGTIKNAGIEAFQAIAKGAMSAIEGIANAIKKNILAPLKEISNSIANILNAIDKKTMGAFGFGELAKSFKSIGDGKPISFDNTWIDDLDKHKTDVKDLYPTWKTAGEKISAEYGKHTTNMTKLSDKFSERFMANSRKEAEARIGLNEKIEKAFTINEGTLRKEDAEYGKHVEILRMRDALNEAAKSNGMLNTSMNDPNSPFTEKATRQMMESALSAQSFSSSLKLADVPLSNLANTFKESASSESMGQMFNGMSEGAAKIGPALMSADPAISSIKENALAIVSPFAASVSSVVSLGQSLMSAATQATGLTTAATGVGTLGTSATIAATGLSTVGTSASSASFSLGAMVQSAIGIAPAIGSAAQSVTGLTQSVATAAPSFSQLAQTAIQAFGSMVQAAMQSGTGIGSSLSQGAMAAANSIGSMIASAINGLAQLISWAMKAASAMAGIGGGGGGGGGGGNRGGIGDTSGGGSGSSIRGGGSGGFNIYRSSGSWGGRSVVFNKGGYTGNGGVNDVAGLVHGQEYVMPADATKRYRPMLEAMRNGSYSGGSSSGSGGSGSGLNVTVQNYGSSKIAVEQLSATEVRIIAREESQSAVMRESPSIVAQHLRNPNSKVSKALSSSTSAKRRR